MFLEPDSGKGEIKKLCTVLIKGIMNWLMDISCWIDSKFLDAFMNTSPKSDLPAAPSLQFFTGDTEAYILHEASEKTFRVVI